MIRNTDCQGRMPGTQGGAASIRRTRGPPNRKAEPAPMKEPAMNRLMARGRRARSNRSPIRETAQGATAASPNPTPSRAANSGAKPKARLAAEVMALQTATPKARIPRRETRSAAQPNGSPTAT